MSDYSILHQANIIIHIIFGSSALFIGCLALIFKKGGKTHKTLGRLFLISMAFVILTGLVGVFLFGVNVSLLMVTALSGYNAFSGYRVIKNKTLEFKFLDIAVALFTAGTAIYFIYYIKSIGLFWAPVVMYSLVGALFLLISYDLLRYFIPANKYKGLWLYEHIYKIIAAFTALLSAFIGTVFPQYHPYSQFVPSILGMSMAFIFMFYYYRKSKNSGVK